MKIGECFPGTKVKYKASEIKKAIGNPFGEVADDEIYTIERVIEPGVAASIDCGQVVITRDHKFELGKEVKDYVHPKQIEEYKESKPKEKKKKRSDNIW
jgi:hypothetical protein